MSTPGKTCRRILRGGGGLAAALMLTISLAQANVTQNVTFTVKNDGRVEAWTDIGTFDSAGNILAITQNQFPSSFVDMTVLRSSKDAELAVVPVGYNITNRSWGNIGSFRISYLRHQSAFVNWDRSTSNGSCDGGTTIYSGGDLRINTNNKSISMRCTSNKMYHSYPVGHYYFYPLEMRFQFFENTGGIASLARKKIPAGTYVFPTYSFRVSQMVPSGSDFTVTKTWFINIRIIVDPSMAEVNMPSTMEMVVRDTGNNRLVGEGAVQISAQGTLGRNLRIEPRSANGGKLMKGSEEIPYTLSVSTLHGDYKRHLLIDNGRVQAPAVIPLYGRDFDYPLRLSAQFDTPKSGLTSGNFRDRVTLVFSTTDVP